jgi:hypothetical protein
MISRKVAILSTASSGFWPWFENSVGAAQPDGGAVLSNPKVLLAPAPRGRRFS